MATERESDIEQAEHLTVSGDTLHVEIRYPRIRSIRAVQANLLDVRAADDIRIEYDFERDGWMIKQASRFSWPSDVSEMDHDWQEVAFVQAWGRMETEVEEAKRPVQGGADR